MELQKIGNHEISVKTYNGQRVVTFKDIDTVHERPDGTARVTFNKHKDRFVLGEDYFVCSAYEAKKAVRNHSSKRYSSYNRTRIFDVSQTVWR